jgi:hypothetical protein
VPDSWRREHSAAYHITPSESSSSSKALGASPDARRSWWWFGRPRKVPEETTDSGLGGVGVVTKGETANSLSFPNEPEAGSWHWLDAAGMVGFCLN